MVLEVAHGSTREMKGPKKTGLHIFRMPHGPANGIVARNLPLFPIESMVFPSICPSTNSGKIGWGKNVSMDLLACKAFKGLRWLMRAETTITKTMLD